MAIAAVAATKLTGAGNNASGAVSATAANAIICGGVGYNGTAWSVTRTGDTYTTDTSGQTSASVDKQIAAVASAPNVAGGSVTLTATSTGATGVRAYALEVSGLATSSMLDATSPAIKTGSSTSATSNSLTNATADAIYVAVVGSESGANPATVTSGSGWTQVVGGTTMTETNGVSAPVSGQQYQIVSTAAARNGSWTVSNAAWGAVIAVYKQASAGAQDTPELYGRPDGRRGSVQLAQLLAQ